MIELNSEYEVYINDEDSIGNGITRINNFVVFVSGALKNEKMIIKITELNKKYAKGKIINIIEPSSNRKDVKCSSYINCGSCSFLHTSKSHELEIKYNAVKKLFNRDIELIDLNNEYYYRNKAIFHVSNNKIGYYSEKTHNIIEFNECLLLDKRINELYKYFKGINLKTINEILIRTTESEIMIKTDGVFDYNELISKFNIDSLYINDECVYGKKYLTEIINGIKYTINPDSFFQVNKEGMIAIYNKVKEYAATGNKLLDLYCGTGTIGIYLKDNYKNVVGIEVNKSSIINANLNKDINGIHNIKFILNDSKNALKDKYDTIIVDPPRNGLSREVVNYLNNSKSNKIIYVSCNYKTLKRDIDLISNYEITNISMVNMFSKTYHIEVICLLENKKV